MDSAVITSTERGKHKIFFDGYSYTLSFERGGKFIIGVRVEVVVEVQNLRIQLIKSWFQRTHTTMNAIISKPTSQFVFLR